VAVFCRLLKSPVGSPCQLPGVDWRTQKGGWFEALERAGIAVEAKTVGRRALPEWLAGRLRAQNQQADRDTLDFIAERVEGNLLAAQQAIERIALAAPSCSLDESAVAALVSDSARFDVFELATAAFSGDAVRALRILAGLRAEGQEPPLLLWALLADLRALSRVVQRLSRTRSVDESFRAERVWMSRQPALRAALPRLSRPVIDGLLVAAARADRVAKGALEGDPWLELESLVARISGVRLAA